jgi:mRNA interferase HigB
MKVRLLRKDTIEEFVANHANGKKHFEKLLLALSYADWEISQDIVITFSGNLLGNNRVVFDLGGNGSNAFRMICSFVFGRKRVHLYVNWLGTHEEYNRLSNNDKLTISMY